MEQKILVTGATGFVGRNLVSHLMRAGYPVRATSRRSRECPMPDLRDRKPDWHSLLKEMDTVIHLAGLADSNNAREHEQINHLATAELVKQAKELDVRRFIFVSSVAAQAELSYGILRESNVAAPSSAYGKSKLAAEVAVQNSGVNYTILRPVPMYGSELKGNLALLEKLSRLPIPLPFGSLEGKRSLLSIENFCSGVAVTLNNPSAVGQIFLMADPAPVSVPELVANMRSRRGRKPGLLNLSPSLVQASLKMVGMERVWNRLGESLIVDTAQLRSLGWKPKSDYLFAAHQSKVPDLLG